MVQATCRWQPGRLQANHDRCYCLAASSVRLQTLGQQQHLGAVQVLRRLPQLQNLDGRDVEPSERAGVGACLRHEAAIMTLMLANANLAHKLVRVACSRLSVPSCWSVCRARSWSLSCKACRCAGSRLSFDC